MKRRKIGVIIAQAEENSQSLFMKGLMEEAYVYGYDICVFSMYLRFQDTLYRQIGDSNIYNLIQWDAFDAIIVLPDTIQATDIATRLEDKIHEVFSGVVLFVDKDSRYFPTVKINHYKPYKKLIDHLIEVHHYSDIMFLDGWKNHVHSIQREQAYRDSLTEHGIPVDPNNIYYGNYWYDSGKEVVKLILDSREKLPEAIACANDCMAIGVAAELFSNHIHVPEQVAVIGYDSTEEGKNLKCKLTSADIPARECGRYCAKYIHASFEKEPIPEFESESVIFQGTSCGCEGKMQPEKYFDEKENFWNTDHAKTGYSSYYNKFMEDLLSERDHRGFFNTIFQHVYQVRPFHSLSICMNDYWNSSEVMTSEDALRSNGYTDKVYRIIKCGPSEHTDNRISFDDIFEMKEMIPELSEQREYPETFFFTPLYFDNRSFGYAVIGFTDIEAQFTEVYRNWLKSIMQSMEAFYRQNGLRELLRQMEATQIRDAMTGLYNYKGFLQKGNELCENATFDGKSIAVIAIDINKLKNINAGYGRKAGDAAILKLAQLISESQDDDAICARISNDEFVVAFPVEASDETCGEAFIKRLSDKIKQYNELRKEAYELEICTGIRCDMISGSEALDHLINETINVKNNKKAIEQGKEERAGVLTDKQKADDHLMEFILDNNRFVYHFQPIINARTGDVYAYEALMRADTERRISPLDMLESADRLNRLYDIEKATFFNVVDYIEEHSQDFEGKKVFINSIPGYQLTGKDKKKLTEIMEQHAGELVVEFTEETEMGDDQLKELKNSFAKMNIETAIDDYGSGYSNVNNLLRYMPRFVKIDRMLMTDIHKDIQKQHFVKDIIEFAHDNDILTLAEGIELTQELREVIKLGVDLIQGYYTSRPQPYVVRSIDERVMNEIVQYNQSLNARLYKKEYETDYNDTVSMVQLAANKYTSIKVKKARGINKKIIIKGSVGFQPNILMSVEDGFRGTIILENVSLAGERGIPCIDIGKKCNVNLQIAGENELRTGGIRVPDSSVLTVVGDGNLTINLNSGKYFGIGNSLDEYHGELNFYQDGGIIINANGMKGIGIGSGLGGVINIKRGHYEFDMKGQEGACIGSVNGDAELFIEYCDMDIYSGISNGTIIGSVNGNADIKLENISAKLQGAGNIITGIGTIAGNSCMVRLENVNISSNIRAKECYGIGCRAGRTDIYIGYAAVKSVVQGKAAVAFGNSIMSAKLYCSNADVGTNAVTEFHSDIGALEKNIQLENGRAEFVLNGQEVKRQILAARL